VEWELQLIDAASRLLRQDAREVISALRKPEEAGPQAKIHDELMQSAVEVVTGVCSTVSEAVADLAATIADLQRITDMRGTMLACAGTHPVSDWRDAKMAPVQRYAELVEQMQWLARRIQTFGVHVHVGLRDGSKAIPIVNALAAYLPHFLALTASSPFWGGDTGLASAGRSSSAGCRPQIAASADWSEFEEYMDTLLRAGTIRSIKEVVG
jgi:carboxylate-amine ligase